MLLNMDLIMLDQAWCNGVRVFPVTPDYSYRYAPFLKYSFLETKFDLVNSFSWDRLSPSSHFLYYKYVCIDRNIHVRRLLTLWTLLPAQISQRAQQMVVTSDTIGKRSWPEVASEQAAQILAYLRKATSRADATVESASSNSSIFSTLLRARNSNSTSV